MIPPPTEFSPILTASIEEERLARLGASSTQDSENDKKILKVVFK